MYKISVLLLPFAGKDYVSKNSIAYLAVKMIFSGFGKMKAFYSWFSQEIKNTEKGLQQLYGKSELGSISNAKDMLISNLSTILVNNKKEIIEAIKDFETKLIGRSQINESNFEKYIVESINRILTSFDKVSQNKVIEKYYSKLAANKINERELAAIINEIVKEIDVFHITTSDYILLDYLLQAEDEVRAASGKQMGLVRSQAEQLFGQEGISNLLNISGGQQGTGDLGKITNIGNIFSNITKVASKGSDLLSGFTNLLGGKFLGKRENYDELAQKMTGSPHAKYENLSESERRQIRLISSIGKEPVEVIKSAITETINRVTAISANTDKVMIENQNLISTVSSQITEQNKIIQSLSDFVTKATEKLTEVVNTVSDTLSESLKEITDTLASLDEAIQNTSQCQVCPEQENFDFDLPSRKRRRKKKKQNRRKRRSGRSNRRRPRKGSNKPRKGSNKPRKTSTPDRNRPRRDTRFDTQRKTQPRNLDRIDNRVTSTSSKGTPDRRPDVDTTRKNTGTYQGNRQTQTATSKSYQSSTQTHTTTSRSTKPDGIVDRPSGSNKGVSYTSKTTHTPKTPNKSSLPRGGKGKVATFFTASSLATSAGSALYSGAGTACEPLPANQGLSMGDVVDIVDTAMEAAETVQDLTSKKAEEEAKKKAQEEAKKKAEEEAKKRAQEEAKKKAEEEAKRKAQEEAKKKAEEEAKQKAEQEAKKKAAQQAQKEAAEKAGAKAGKEVAQKTTQELAEKGAKELAEKGAKEGAKKAGKKLTKEVIEFFLEKIAKRLTKWAASTAIRRVIAGAANLVPGIGQLISIGLSIWDAIEILILIYEVAEETGIIEHVKQAIMEQIGKAKQYLGEKYEQVKNAFVKGLKEGASFLLGWWSNAGPALKAFWEGVKNVGQAVVQKTQEVGSKIVEFGKKGWGWLKSAFLGGGEDEAKKREEERKKKEEEGKKQGQKQAQEIQKQIQQQQKIVDKQIQQQQQITNEQLRQQAALQNSIQANKVQSTQEALSVVNASTASAVQGYANAINRSPGMMNDPSVSGAYAALSATSAATAAALSAISEGSSKIVGGSKTIADIYAKVSGKLSQSITTGLADKIQQSKSKEMLARSSVQKIEQFASTAQQGLQKAATNPKGENVLKIFQSVSESMFSVFEFLAQQLSNTPIGSMLNGIYTLAKLGFEMYTYYKAAFPEIQMAENIAQMKESGMTKEEQEKLTKKQAELVVTGAHAKREHISIDKIVGEEGRGNLSLMALGKQGNISTQIYSPTFSTANTRLNLDRGTLDNLKEDPAYKVRVESEKVLAEILQENAKLNEEYQKIQKEYLDLIRKSNVMLLESNHANQLTQQAYIAGQNEAIKAGVSSLGHKTKVELIKP